MSKNCLNCNNATFYTLVRYGSYYYQCIKCNEHLVATSFIAVAPGLEGIHDITEVDDKGNFIKRLAIGYVANHVDLISKEAYEGRIIRLKRLL